MSDAPEQDSQEDTFDIEELLARMTPPSVPSEAIERAPGLYGVLNRLDPMRSALLVAGLTTEPQFQANLIRLDWLLRLVLTYGHGGRKAHRSDLHGLLNGALVEAGAVRLEDPPEENFTESIPASRGNFRIFPGYFEKAGTHTEAVIAAFERLAEGPQKTAALRRAYALLRLSDELVARSEAAATQLAPNPPQEDIILPSDERIRSIAKRLHFRDADLQRLGIDPDDLDGFFLKPQHLSRVAALDVGASPLDFRPLVRADNGLQVLSPHTLSTAARACLIECAVTGGQAAPLQYAMLLKQGSDVEDTAFLKLDGTPAQTLGGSPGRDFTVEISSGRYLHVIQTADTFEDWPARAFGIVTACPEALQTALACRVGAVQAFARAQPGFVEGMTLWLAGGWGSARAITDSSLLNDPTWPLLVLEPADAAVLGACANGGIQDIWRLKKIEGAMEAAGFDFVSANGLLNLFQWWRDTDLALMPPQAIDATPPIIINYATNLLLHARREAAVATDRRSRFHPRLGWLPTTRLDRQEFTGPLKPIYISLPHIRRRQLLGCVVHARSTWWISGEAAGDTAFDDTWETWKAALEWAHAVLPGFVQAFGDTAPLHINLQVAPRSDRTPDAILDDNAIAASLTVTYGEEGVSIAMTSEWHWGLHRPDNRAEIELASALQAGARLAQAAIPDFSVLRDLARAAAGSGDFRFRHSLEVHRVIDELRGLGLVGRARTMSRSAAALVKCGSAWEVRQRDQGALVEGLEACVEFLTAFSAHVQNKLITAIRVFDRRRLVTACLGAMQAAEADNRNWENTARALRSIHGVANDHRISMEATSNANGLLRSSAIIAEIAGSEAPAEGGRDVGEMDLEELQALALMVFLAGDALPALYSDRMRPILRISPGGDVLYDHEFHDATLKDSASQRQSRARASASDEYVDRFGAEREVREAEAAFATAIEAEYGVSHNIMREFASAAVSIAEDVGAGAFAIRRSELLGRLAAIPPIGELDFAPMVDRLTMPSRAAWADFPPGSHGADADLSRFDRRYSLIARPIVALDASADPELVVAPAIVERALVHNAHGATTGALQNDFWSSPGMRSFSSQAGAEAGLAFNQEVADGIAALGLRTWPSAKPSWCLNTKKTPEVVQLGDIDVLAVSPDSRTVWVVEAKDLKLCRTLGETCRRLSDYRGVTDQRGRPDALLKHLRRVDFLRANAAALTGPLGLPGTPTVRGLIVVRAPQPMSQLRSEFREDAKVVILTELANNEWAQDG